MSPFKDKIIGVLLGGLSKEREISLKSGEAILDALLLKGYDAVPLDVGRDITTELKTKGVEIAFLALHGRYGEDGSIQGLLEILGIPYTGASVLASALAMDKYLTKEVVRSLDIPCPADCFFDALHDDLSKFLQDFSLDFPVMVKPSREGSTIGIVKAENREELESAVRAAGKIDSRVLIEQFISGREVTVAVLNQEALSVVEVVPKSGFYDFAAKYTPGATEYFCPADLPTELTQLLQQYGQKIYQTLGCEGVARSDFMISSDGTPYFLEINTLPGMTSTSLVPKAARASGISFEDLVEKTLQSARLKIS